jgi:ABC-type multidrug transport system fused ATPase/permease subunit
MQQPPRQLQWLSLPFNRYINLLVKYLKPLRVQVLFLALLIFASTGLQLLNPYIVGYFIDTAQIGGALRELFIAAGAFIGISLLSQGVTLGQRYVAEKTAWQATNALRTDLTHHCLHLDMAFHNSHTPGELVDRIDGDVGELANFFSQFVSVILANAVLLLCVLTVLFWEDWRLGVPMLVFVLFAFQISAYVHRLSTPFWPATREAFARLMGFLEERLASTEEIRANGATDYMLLGLYRHLRERTQTFFRAYMMMVATFSTSIGLISLGSVIALGVGTYLLQQDVITLGTVYLLYRYTTLLIEPIEMVMLEVVNLQQASASIGRIEELLSVKRENLDMDHKATLPLGPLSVEFRDVTFGYHIDSQTPTLENISFTLPPGELLGVVGRTGSGKSTLARLLARLYSVTDGSIIVDGVDTRQLSPQALRQRIGVVTQDVQLFHATIRDNLTFFNRDITDAQILDALHNLGLWKWFSALPQGLDTELTSGGQRLSAGEAQLLAFTRVFLGDPGLVILDEATSRLDPLTETLLEQVTAMLFAQGRRTGIIISHRLATLQRAQQVLVLENGRIAEYGNRQQLAGNPHSHFYRLLQLDTNPSTLEEVSK